MKIILEKKESEEIFFNAMCNGLGYITGYGLELDYEEEEYSAAKAAIKKKRVFKEPCIEDVLMEILKRGGSLTLVDVELDGEYTSTITLKDVHKRVAQTPTDHLLDMINENDDACTADVVLQTVFFQDIIFG